MSGPGLGEEGPIPTPPSRSGVSGPGPGWEEQRGRVFRGAFVELAGTAFLRLLAVARLVLIGRLFLPEAYGAFSTALLVVAVPALLTDAGLRQYVVKSEEGDLPEAFGTALALSSALAVLMALLLLLAAPSIGDVFADPVLPAVLALMAVGLFEIPLTLPAALWERDLRFGIAKVPEVLGLLVGIGGLVAFDALGMPAVWVLAVSWVATLVVRGGAIWWLAPSVRPRVSALEAKRQIRFGWPLLLAACGGYVAARGDDLAVRFLYGNAALGLYALAFYAPAVLQEIAFAIDRATLPAFARLRDPAEARKAFTSSVRVIAAIAAPLGLTVAAFARPVVVAVFGPEWEAAWSLLALFAVAFALRASTGLNWGALALAHDRSDALARGSLLAAAFLVVVGLPLIALLGPIGGAVHTLLLVVVLNPFIRFPVIRDVTGDLSYLRAAVLPIAVAAVGAGAAWMLGSGSMAPLPGSSVAALLVVAELLLLLALDGRLREEMRSLVARPLADPGSGGGPPPSGGGVEG